MEKGQGPPDQSKKTKADPLSKSSPKKKPVEKKEEDRPRPHLGPLPSLVKWPLFLINIPCFLAALVVVAFSIKTLLYESVLEDLVGSEILRTAAGILLASSILACLTSVLGSYGAFVESKREVCCYIASFVISLILLAVAVIFLVIKGKQKGEEFAKRLPEAVTGYKLDDENNQINVLVDVVQSGLTCCGVDAHLLDEKFHVKKKVLEALERSPGAAAALLILFWDGLLGSLENKPWNIWLFNVFLENRNQTPTDIVKTNFSTDDTCCRDFQAPSCKPSSLYLHPIPSDTDVLCDYLGYLPLDTSPKEKASLCCSQKNCSLFFSLCTEVSVAFRVPRSCCQLDNLGRRSDCTEGPKVELLNRDDCLRRGLEFLDKAYVILIVISVVLVVLTILCLGLAITFVCC